MVDLVGLLVDCEREAFVRAVQMVLSNITFNSKELNSNRSLLFKTHFIVLVVIICSICALDKYT